MEAAGTKIAKVKCFPNINKELFFKYGWVTLVIVPQGVKNKLLPSPELIEEVKGYIEERTFPGLTDSEDNRINIIGPGYIKVEINVNIVSKDIDEAQSVKKEVYDALCRLFHPIRGGMSGNGWELGRCVMKPEICRFIEQIDGVDYVDVNSVLIKANVLQQRLILKKSQGSVMNTGGESVSLLQKIISVQNQPQTKIGIVAAQKPEEIIDIRSFKEGDRITAAIDMEILDKDILKGRFTCSISGVDSGAFNVGGLIKNIGSTHFTYLERFEVRMEDGEQLIDLYVSDREFVNDEIKKITYFYRMPMMTVNSIDTISQDTFRLGVGNYHTLYAIMQGTIITTLDNRFRLTLSSDIPADCDISYIDLNGFTKGDLVAYDGNRKEVMNTEIVKDMAYLDDNFFAYSGLHSVNVVFNTDLHSHI